MDGGTPEVSGRDDPRVRVRRHPERGHYDAATIHPILDGAAVCHLGYVVDGRPVVIPTLFGRIDDRLYVHGSAASRAMRSGAAGSEICVTVTHLDGLVLARSLFNHSANYRSVVVHGTATEVTDREEKLAGLEAISEQLVPGRWSDARLPTDTELKATTVLRLPLDAASAKVRTGDPEDDAGDHDLDVWAGVVPLRTVRDAPVPSSDLRPGIAEPPYLR